MTRLPSVWAVLSAALSRVMSRGRYIPEIDGLRFVAIMMVVAFHVRGYVAAKFAPAGGWAVPPDQDWLGRAALHGHFGVQLFFVISGFVLGRPFAAAYLAGGPPVRLGAYFARRVTRLEPPYIISLLLMFGLLVAWRGEPVGELAPHLLAHVAYLHNLLFPGTPGVQFVAWSLEIEVQFYVLAPLLAFAFAGRHAYARLLLALAAAVMIGQWVTCGTHVPHFLTLAGFAQFFLGGFLLAGLSVTRWVRPPGVLTGRLWDGVSLVGWPALFLIWESAAATFWLLPPVLTMLTAAAIRGHASRRVFGFTPVARIGGMCYSIYLVHYLLISLVGRLSGRVLVTDSFAVNLLIQMAVLVPVVVAGSAVFFVIAERPFMTKHWPARVWSVLTGRPRSRPLPEPQ